ncbi:hypothetical protein PtA15_6A177 [Puccinia triticina]|uniref:Uncharacterized protein n=1 Tax=Puccinia triticina TaxID=208348 RepID=A0ABY7CK89_9BASI|nr:uncharacterized protein PtA15_6A177 [Puccinia triticina]WAQ85549.1 hypothetical protein PtA15_6A177 [Puccinia triticina]
MTALPASGPHVAHRPGHLPGRADGPVDVKAMRQSLSPTGVPLSALLRPCPPTAAPSHRQPPSADGSAVLLCAYPQSSLPPPVTIRPSEACPSASHITAAQKPDVCGLCTQPRLVRKRFTPGPPSLPPLGRADAGLTALLDGGERPTREPRPGQVANGHGRTQCDGHRAFRRLCENAGTFDHP